MTRWLLVILVATAGLRARGMDDPRRSPYDPRVRFVDYNPNDVVQVDTVIGIATHMVLEQGERYVIHAFGDSEAWSFNHTDNHLFIKPKADQAQTNLIVVTDRRSYCFRLRYSHTRLASAVYQLEFRYPDSEASRTGEAARQEALEQGFGLERAGYNLQYTMSGDVDIAPVNAWDNKEFTFFKFPGNRDIPAIYMVDPAGEESIVNRHTVGEANDVVVLHKVNARWVMRLGDRALAVFNERFSPDGVANTSGTSSAAVKRVIREERRGTGAPRRGPTPGGTNGSAQREGQVPGGSR